MADSCRMIIVAVLEVRSDLSKCSFVAMMIDFVLHDHSTNQFDNDASSESHQRINVRPCSSIAVVDRRPSSIESRMGLFRFLRYTHHTAHKHFLGDGSLAVSVPTVAKVDGGVGNCP